MKKFTLISAKCFKEFKKLFFLSFKLCFSFNKTKMLNKKNLKIFSTKKGESILSLSNIKRRVCCVLVTKTY